jgi:hypothetical protein
MKEYPIPPLPKPLILAGVYRSFENKDKYPNSDHPCLNVCSCREQSELGMGYLF